MGEPARGQSMEALMKATRAGIGHAITQPVVNTDFEVKHQILNMITHQCQFRGTPKEDAFEHLRSFKSIYGAKDWLESLPEGEIDSWTTMEVRFLKRFFPASKAAKLQSDINHFVQKSNETLYDARTRFGKLLRNCPQHRLNNFNKVQIFYKGVNVPIRKEIDIFAVKAQLATVERQMESMTKEMHAMKVGCELCQGPHLTKDCNQSTMEEHVNYLAQSLTERPPGALPSNTQTNSNNNGPVQTILTNTNRSDVKNKVLQVSNYSQVNAIYGVESYGSDEVSPTYTHNSEDSWTRVSDTTPAYGNYLMSLMTGSSSSSGNQESEVKSVETTDPPEISVNNVENIEVEEKVISSPKLQVYKPPIPYPKAIHSEKPKETVYLMAKKGVHEQAFSAFLEAECAAIVKKSDMPPKLGDPGPFVVPGSIDGSGLNLGDLKPTSTGVRLINQSVSKPVGIIENLVIKVGELEFPTDFVVVDMIADKVIPIVLGRPFLATAGALTDWKTGKLVLRDRGKTLSFETKFIVKPPPTSVDYVNVLNSSETDNDKTKISKNPKCRGVGVKEKPVVKLSDDSVVDRSMRRLFGRIKKVKSEKDELVRIRLVSNLPEKEKENLRELTRESRAADDWLLSMIDNGNLSGGSYGLKDEGTHHPGIS
ncbi:uncharacterized protein [Rutidosis leptorrhynchoides]|uniref:uncharacterized protein n=1 Tax=Rutidosis leptorrhynchoides TaxID=125765 RepID=UPI003A994EFC